MTLTLLADLAQILAEAFLEPGALLKGRIEALLEDHPAPALTTPLRRMAEAGPGAEDQAVEYARLFLHAKDTDTVHLFESVQARGHHMAPEILGPLQAIYDGAGLSLQDGLATPPDHLGLELACLGYLLDLAAEGSPQERAEAAALARRLIRDHLRPFVAEVASQLPQVQAHPYYLAAGDLASAFLPEAEKALAEI